MGEPRYRSAAAGEPGDPQHARAPRAALQSSAPGDAAPDEPVLHVEPIPVRVRFVEERSGGRWQVSQWRPVAVEQTDRPEPDGLAIELFPDEAEGYYLNLTSGSPSIMIRWRLPEDESGVVGQAGVPHALAITLSYNEAGRWMDGGERVDPVPMPAPMSEWLAEFVRLHWRPEKRHRQRGPKPSFMRRPEFSEMVERERQALLRAQGEVGDAEGRATPSAGAPGAGQRGGHVG